jgi:hypothetical protein
MWQWTRWILSPQVYDNRCQLRNESVPAFSFQGHYSHLGILNNESNTVSRQAHRPH